MSAVSPSGRVQLPPVSARRRNTDRAMRLLLLALTLVALVPLVLVIYYLIKKGASSIKGAFFTQDPTGSFFGSVGGARSAILGSIEIILIASIIAIPLGIAVGVYLTEYGRDARFARTVRYFVDVMTGVPSIVFGLFIYVTLVLSRIGGAFTGWKGAVAIALLMLPVVARSAEVVLQLVPSSLREAALALGAPRWRVIARVVLPAAIPGLVTGSLLAVARGIGETAPLLFTAATQNGLTFDPGSQMNSLPSQIYYDITSPQVALQNQAWACGLTLVVIVLILNLGARGIARRSRL